MSSDKVENILWITRRGESLEKRELVGFKQANMSEIVLTSIWQSTVQ